MIAIRAIVPFLITTMLAGPALPVIAGVVHSAPIPGLEEDEVIAFGATADGVRQIHLTQMDGPTPLGALGGAGGDRDVDPAWSHDGAIIAFARKTVGSTQHDIYVIRPDGDVATRRSAGGPDDRQPAWSPTGRIAFARTDPITGRGQIMVMNGSGSGLTSLTPSKSGRHDAAPTWSPDGGWVAFARSRNGGFPQLWAVSPGTGQQIQLTDGTCMDANPSWSTGGIVFDRTCPTEDSLPDLYRVPWDGQGSVPAPVSVERLTTTPGVAEFDADWSPQGDHVVFATHAAASGDANLTVSALLPWAPTVVAGGPASELGPDWHHLPREPYGPCTVIGTTGPDDPLVGTGSDDVICALGGDDRLVGGAGDDVLLGGTGDDVLLGEAGADTIVGGAGSDTASYETTVGLSGVTVDLSLGTATGGDTLDGVENVTGSPQADQLTGDANPNVFTGGGGGDALDGGGGSDTASYASAGTGVTVDLSAGTAGDGDTLTRIEDLIGSSHDDTLIGDDADNVLAGAAGNDTLSGGGGEDTASYAGASAAVTVDLGLDGVAQQPGGAGADTLTGIENVIGSAHDDQLLGNELGNRLWGGDGDDQLSGLAGHDHLDGGEGTNVLTGGDGNDELRAGAGEDVLRGDSGNDELLGGSGNDLLEGGPGNDRLLGERGHDRLVGGSGNDGLAGGSGDDTLKGDSGSDSLYGEDGQDHLVGGSGRDRFSGGNGNDYLSARDGVRESVSGGPGYDKGRVDRRDRKSSVDSFIGRRRYRIRSSRVASGITLKKLKDRRKPNRIFVLVIDTKAGRRMDTALAGNQLKGFERTSTMAKRTGAIAGVNGDFGLPSGRPAHHLAVDGDLKQTSDAYGYHFAPGADGARHFGGHQDVTLDSVLTRGERWDVSGWNDGLPGNGELTAVASSSGGLEPAPSYSCSARVTQAIQGSMQWAEDQKGVRTQHTVQEVACRSASMHTQGGIVLSARAMGEEGAFLRGLVPGEAVTLSWTLGWAGVTDAVGGYPQLMRSGRIVAKSCSQSLCKRHPRTGVGILPSGKVLLVVVDGRRKRSKGMTLVQFAKLFERLGASWALNLDGGGSSTMWIRGRGIVNRPSDGRERYVSSSLLVLGGSDGGESALATGAGTAGQTGDASDASLDPQAGRRAAEDPGSTGGFLEALEAGTLSPPMELTGELRQALSLFRVADER